MVRTYSVKRDGDKRVSEHFRVREFRCKDGADTVLISDETVKVLESIRAYFGKPITITSAYRTPSHNRAVGGANGSQHVKGTACDIKVKDVPSWAVAGFLEANFKGGGIGYYSTFTHVDTRGHSVKWKDSGSNVKGTFGIGRNYELYRAKIVENVKQEEPELTIEEIKHALLKDEAFCIKAAEIYAEKQRKSAAGQWSEPARKWALAHGIFNQDSEWKAPLTREQAAQVVYNIDRRNADDGK